MNRLIFLGLGFFLAAALLVLFESIGAMMAAGEVIFKMSSPVELLGEGAFVWIDRVPTAFAREMLTHLTVIPAWITLAGLGLVFILIGGLRSR